MLNVGWVVPLAALSFLLATNLSGFIFGDVLLPTPNDPFLGRTLTAHHCRARFDSHGDGAGLLSHVGHFGDPRFFAGFCLLCEQLSIGTD
jgi:hypothetical protein